MSITNLPLQIHHFSFSFYFPSAFSSEASSGLQQAPCLQAGLQPDNTDTSIDNHWQFNGAVSCKKCRDFSGLLFTIRRILKQDVLSPTVSYSVFFKVENVNFVMF